MLTARLQTSILLLAHQEGKVNEMAASANNDEFESWQRALAENKLTPEQLAVLEGMVKDGQAEDLKAAATMRDWQESVINPEEHMYGF